MDACESHPLLNERFSRTLNMVERYLSNSPVPELFRDQNAMSSFFNQMPLPAWIKKESGEMFDINKAYERIYHIPRGLYRNSDDIVQWGEYTAAGFDDTDQKAVRDGSAFAVEYARSAVDGHRLRILVFKFRIDVATENGPSRMVAGIAVTHWSKEWFGMEQGDDEPGEGRAGHAGKVEERPGTDPS